MNHEFLKVAINILKDVCLMLYEDESIAELKYPIVFIMLAIATLMILASILSPPSE